MNKINDNDNVVTKRNIALMKTILTTNEIDEQYVCKCHLMPLYFKKVRFYDIDIYIKKKERKKREMDTRRKESAGDSLSKPNCMSFCYSEAKLPTPKSRRTTSPMEMRLFNQLIEYVSFSHPFARHFQTHQHIA